MDWLAEALGDDWLAFGGLLASGLGLVAWVAFGWVRARLEVRQRAAADAPGMPAFGPGSTAGPALQRFVGRLEATFAQGDSSNTRLLRRKLLQAGFFDHNAVALFFAARVAAAVVLAGAGLIAFTLTLESATTVALWLYAGGLGAAGYFAPTFYLRRRIGKRVAQHRAGFPDFMDLMVVCAEAGLSMEAAIDRIARELVQGYPSLAENLYVLSLEIRAGKSFTEALERLGGRLGIEEAVMLATLLQQSAELGTSLSQSLRVYSDEMRNKRMARAEERAYALPAKLVVPLTLFVFPVLIATLLLPAIIQLSGAFKN